MKKNTKRFLLITATAVASIYAYNRFVATTSVSKHMLSDENGSFYKWKYGNIFYTKRGTGSPLLLVHDITPSSSSFEWCKLMKKLEKHHTVYTIDLLGCGRSDKPALIYTNYMYVQLLSSFVKDVVGDKTDVIATNMSASFAIMSKHMNPDLFNQLILINPASLKRLRTVTDEKSKLRKSLYEIPMIGTFLYNLKMNPKFIDLQFRENYFHKPQLISSKLEDVYYESAHLNESSGRYLYASILGEYMNIDITHALKKFDDSVSIIGSRDIRGNVQNLEEYLRINPELNMTYISGSKLLPQLEIPDKMLHVIQSILED